MLKTAKARTVPVTHTVLAILPAAPAGFPRARSQIYQPIPYTVPRGSVALLYLKRLSSRRGAIREDSLSGARHGQSFLSVLAGHNSVNSRST